MANNINNQTDTQAQITTQKITNQCTDITYPQIWGLKDKKVQNSINELIRKKVDWQIPREGCAVYAEIFGKYEVMLNKKNLLSINLQFYTIRKQAANGLDVQKSVNVDLLTGKDYQLYELFKRGSNYRATIDKMIEEQIREKNLHLIKDFNGITDFEDYYLTEDALVIYFQELEYTIHAEGIPEFIIPYSRIKNLIDKNGPIGRLINNK